MMVMQSHVPGGATLSRFGAAHGTLVVAYLRKSSSGKRQQEHSIADQRQQVQAYCDARGWVIVAWYVDEKSASKNQHHRKDFQRLLADAKSPGRQWAGVVAWSTDRLSRSNSLDSEWAKIFHESGVFVETIQDGGRIDLDSMNGRMMLALKAETNHDYSVKLSGNTVRGRNLALADGYWPHGKVPYGYDRLYVRPGCESIRLPRQAPAGRPQGYRLKLAVNDAEAKTVRWIFAAFLGGRSRRSIAAELNRKGVPIPYGTAATWQSVTIRQVLQTPAYIGVNAASFNHKREHNRGKWNRVSGNAVAGSVPTIIGTGDFETAQRLLADAQNRGRLHSTPRHESGVLSGLLICGGCSDKLKKGRRQQRVCGSCGLGVPRVTPSGKCKACGDAIGNVTRPRIYYYCPSSNFTPGNGCRAHTVMEDEVLPLIADKLLARVEAEVLAKVLATPADEPNPNLDGLKARRDDLRKMVAKGNRNLALLDDPGTILDVQAQVKTWRDELEAVEAEIGLAERIVTDDERKAVVGWLDTVKGDWVEVKPAMVMFHQCPHPVTLTAAEEKQARRQMESSRSKVAYVTNKRVVKSYDALEGRHVLQGWEIEPAVNSDRLTARRESLRGLLSKLGVSIACHWKPNPNGHGEVPDLARISAKFELPLPLSSGGHVW